MSSKVYFDSVAGQWDRLRTGFFSEAVRIKALEKADLKSGVRAADLGAGTGFMTEGLMQHNVQVYAIDQSQEMLTVLAQKFAVGGNIICLQGQSERLPLEDRSVEYTFANMYLHHVEEPAGAICEMNRILIPGGKAIITDLDLHRFDFLLKEHHDRWPGFKREHVKQWLLTAGFTEVTVEGINQNCCAKSECGDGQAEVSIFLATGLKL